MTEHVECAPDLHRWTYAIVADVDDWLSHHRICQWCARHDVQDPQSGEWAVALRGHLSAVP